MPLVKGLTSCNAMTLGAILEGASMRMYGGAASGECMSTEDRTAIGYSGGPVSSPNYHIAAVDRRYAASNHQGGARPGLGTT